MSASIVSLNSSGKSRMFSIGRNRFSSFLKAGIVLHRTFLWMNEGRILSPNRKKIASVPRLLQKRGQDVCQFDDVINLLCVG
jgi:hypothetical protein